MSVVQRWMQQPQNVLCRRMLFQVHLWTGLVTGCYIAAISVSGSVLVYRDQLYRKFEPRQVLVEVAGSALSDAEVSNAAQRRYPEYTVADLRRGDAENQAVEMVLQSGDQTIRRLFDPFTAEDLGDPIPVGYRFTSWLLDFHDNLLAGRSGRRLNGVGALFALVLCATGAVIWWPGARSWRGSLKVPLRSRHRFSWSLHSALGFWFFGFIVLWGLTGVYLAFPDVFATAFDYIQPFDESNPEERTVDRIQYWLAYLHFGRLGGRGIPGCGRGLCDSMTKALWAGAALVPPAMFVTGALMWWNRVLRPALRRSRQQRVHESPPRASTHFHATRPWRLPLGALECDFTAGAPNTTLTRAAASD